MTAETARNNPGRRGGVYIAVLGTAMIVSLVGMAALAGVRAQRLTARATSDSVKARLYAQSGVELAMQWIAADSSWRTNRVNGTWASGQIIGDGSLTITGTDPIDGSLANRTSDPLVIQSTGIRGSAVQIVQARMTATGTPLDCLKMAIHTAGNLHMNAGSVNFTAQGAPASTNTSFTNDGTVTGSVECSTTAKPGTVTGTLTLLAPSKAMPSSGVVAMYASLGTPLSGLSGTNQNFLLSPSSNPWGATNADGVYVYTTSGDLIIKNCRIYGTLVVVNPGKKVTIDQSVFFQPVRPDYPVLIVDGNVVLQFDTTSQLSESSCGTNFNPAGSPYLGATNSNTTDLYPSEINGLVHVRGTLEMKNTALVRGCVICESATGSDDVKISNTPKVIYDPALFSSPPMGYTKSVTMALQPGSWKQVVLP